MSEQTTDVQPSCHDCRRAIVGQEGVKKRKNGGDEPVWFHTGCWELRERARREQQDHHDRLIARSAEKGIDAMPPGPRVSHPDFEKYVKTKRFRAFAERFEPTKSAVLLGLTGLGKTSAARCAVYRFYDAAIAESSLRGPAMTFACRMCWTTGHALIRARREHKLGDGEAELIERAINASLLVVDELGHESTAPDAVLFEIIDTRYGYSRPTIVTSGLTGAAFREHYGDAFFRRLAENGVVIEERGGGG